MLLEMNNKFCPSGIFVRAFLRRLVLAFYSVWSSTQKHIGPYMFTYTDVHTPYSQGKNMTMMGYIN